MIRYRIAKNGVRTRLHVSGLTASDALSVLENTRCTFIMSGELFTINTFSCREVIDCMCALQDVADCNGEELLYDSGFEEA